MNSSVLSFRHPFVFTPVLALACALLGGAPVRSAPDSAATPANKLGVDRSGTGPGKRIIVSLAQRRLWLVAGQDTLLSAPIAVGRDGSFQYKGETFRWSTPRGQRSVHRKKVDPVWVPPDWHYYEKASYRDLEPVKMERGKKYVLSDGTYLEVRGDQAGRVNRFGNFWPWTPGKEIIFDGKIFIPPLDTAQREVPNALGPYALSLGNGYLIHGTWKGNRGSIGSAASHGCIRMYNEDVSKLYQMVEVGTPVVIR